MKNTLFAIAAIALAGSASQAGAADRFNAGVLVCNAGSSIGMIVESKQELACTFTPSDNSAVQHYAGTITTIGIDLGVTGSGVMTWGVLAVTKDPVVAGALAGPYGGVTGNVAVGVGVGANVLVGNSNSFALNPISVEGNVGASLALGVAGLTLVSKP
ncbi:DUF992 domain-containing protein [Ancylobacter amanitiformis]|uniref:DUF992 domain-containing protein n=1 Tax=Ancylobacter amanitiformis TaxID=217069 RepID=A0ABU0LNA9_9HYPH|nr:DUF992 domain-containing protein [Ancylobacter amanitiformis]MDQ0510188.1 hypothetical protein [Ancylobacter amanitiformis]